MRILPASDSSILVVFGDSIEPAYHNRTVTLFRQLRATADPRIRNLHPAYASLLVDFDPLRMTHEEATGLIDSLASAAAAGARKHRAVEIPVCYDLEFGPDLPTVAAQSGLSVEEVIAAHLSAEYCVYFLGFSPGFGYLGGLPPQLATPRLATPRKVVPAGSVGIAGDQTGVYPVDSPGGWQIIGRTPLLMFQFDAQNPTRLEPGDSVRFRAITRDEFDLLLNSPQRTLE